MAEHIFSDLSEIQSNSIHDSLNRAIKIHPVDQLVDELESGNITNEEYSQRIREYVNNAIEAMEKPRKDK